MHVTIVNGTARTDSKSQHVARALYEALTTVGRTVELISVADHVSVAATIPPWGEGGADTHPTAWQRTVEATDVFIFVLPEYNHGYPGEWKLLMDRLYSEYAGKQAYVAAVGGGAFAGARVMEHVLPVLVNFKFTVGAARLHINAATALDESGTIVDPHVRERMTAFVEAVTRGTV